MRRKKSAHSGQVSPPTAHWGIPDPAAVRGSDAEVQRAFRDAFFILDRRISLLLCLPLKTLDSLALKKELDKIGETMTPAAPKVEKSLHNAPISSLHEVNNEGRPSS
jgi:hypothetical protein